MIFFAGILFNADSKSCVLFFICPFFYLWFFVLLFVYKDKRKYEIMKIKACRIESGWLEKIFVEMQMQMRV